MINCVILKSPNFQIDMIDHVTQLQGDMINHITQLQFDYLIMSDFCDQRVT